MDDQTGEQLFKRVRKFDTEAQKHEKRVETQCTGPQQKVRDVERSLEARRSTPYSIDRPLTRSIGRRRGGDRRKYHFRRRGRARRRSRYRPQAVLRARATRTATHARRTDGVPRPSPTSISERIDGPIDP